MSEMETPDEIEVAKRAGDVPKEYLTGYPSIPAAPVGAPRLPVKPPKEPPPPAPIGSMKYQRKDDFVTEDVPYGIKNGMARQLSLRGYAIKNPDRIDELIEHPSISRETGYQDEQGRNVRQFVHRDWQDAWDEAQVGRRTRVAREPIRQAEKLQTDFSSYAPKTAKRVPEVVSDEKEMQRGVRLPEPDPQHLGDTRSLIDLGRAIDFSPGSVSPGSQKVVHQLQGLARGLHGAGSDKMTQKRYIQASAEQVMYMLAHAQPGEKPGDPTYSGKGWYREDIKLARETAVAYFPELKNDGDWKIFTTFLALTCANKPVLNDFKDAISTYKIFRDTGKIGLYKENKLAAAVTAGPGEGNWDGKLKGMVEYFGGGREGFIAFADWMNQKSKVADIRKVQIESGVYKKGQLIQGKNEDEVYNATMWGPKVGPFFTSMHGNVDQSVVDTWAIRSWKLMHDDIKKKWTKNKKGELEVELDTSSSVAIRESYNNMTEAVGKKLGLEKDDVQAILWYYQKRLEDVLGISPREEVDSFGKAAEVAFQYYTGGIEEEVTRAPPRGKNAEVRGPPAPHGRYPRAAD